MRKTLLIVVISLLFGLLPATAQDEVVLDQIYDDGTVAFFYPSGWTAVSDDTGDVVLSSTDASLGRIIDQSNALTLDPEEALIEFVFGTVWDLMPQNVFNTSVLSGYLMAWDLAILAELGDFQVRHVEETEVAGHPATVMEYTVIGYDESRFTHVYTATLLINNGILVVQAQTRSDLDGYYRELVALTETIIETLDFIPPPYADGARG